MTRHYVLYPVLCSTSDWSCCVENLLQPIRSTTQIWVVTRYHYRISKLVSFVIFARGNHRWRRLFFQAKTARMARILVDIRVCVCWPELGQKCRKRDSFEQVIF